VPVERAVEIVDDSDTGEAGEEVMVDALLPEHVDREQEGKVDVRAEAHAMVQDVVEARLFEEVIATGSMDRQTRQTKSIDRLIQQRRKRQKVIKTSLGIY